MLLLVALLVGSTSMWADDIYTKVTSTEDLVVGGEYVLVEASTNTKYLANRTYSSSKYGSVTSGFTLSQDGNTVSIATTTQALVLRLGGSANEWTLYDTNYGWLGKGSSSTNFTRSQSANVPSGNAYTWTIKTKGSDLAIYSNYNQSGTNHTNRWIGRNSSTTGPYSDSQYPAYVMYKKTVAEKHTLSSAVSPIGAGTVTLGSTSVGEGLTTTISANENVGYRFLNWTTTSGTITNTSSASTTFMMGTSDATVTANFETCETYTISWSVNGTIVSSETLNEGSKINFVAPVSGIPAGYAYKGWSTTEIVTPQQSEPSYITEATCTSDVTYYCVMAKENGTPSSLTKMAAGDKFTSGDKIVFAAIDEDNSFGMYQQTQGTNWIKNFEFTEDVDEIAADNKKWWTVTSTTGGWYIGDTTNGRLYSSSSTNLACSTTNQTVFVFEDGDDGTFQLSYTNGSKRYLCCRTDQTGDNKNAFRLSGSDGINKLTLYKYVAASISYSDYATVVSVTKEVSAAGWATYITPYAVEFSEGDAYVVTNAEASTTLTEVTSVSAGTPVLLKGEGEKTATVIASAADPASNLLKVSNGSVMGDNATIYVLARRNNVTGFYLWDSEASAIPAGKVYLDTKGTPAKGLEFISFENSETDGIRSIENGELRIENSDYYNLAGQKVGKDYKGIVIVNGKKIVRK